MTASLGGTGDVYGSWSIYGTFKTLQLPGHAGERDGCLPRNVNSAEPAGADPARLLGGLPKEKQRVPKMILMLLSTPKLLRATPRSALSPGTQQ